MKLITKKDSEIKETHFNKGIPETRSKFREKLDEAMENLKKEKKND
jgi:hypothetical protein